MNNVSLNEPFILIKIKNKILSECHVIFGLNLS